MPQDEQITIEFKAEIKDIAEDGTFSGIASVYGVEDLTGDIIDKGAFTKTLSESPMVPILWQHQRGEIMGEGEVKEWQGKILINGKLDMEDPDVVKRHGKMKRKLIKGLSIGFRTVKSVWEEIEGRMIRHITELKLFEVSVVTFPALPQAQVTRVKQMSPAHRSRMNAAMAAMEKAMADHEKDGAAFMAKHDEAMAKMQACMEDMASSKDDQALSTEKATPTEPAKVEEPPVQQGTEPANHSALSSQIDQLKGALVWSH